MKIIYQNKEVEIDNDNIPGRDEFDYFDDDINLEDTIEINVDEINNPGDNNEQS